MSVKLGIAPIAWSNDDMPELGGDTSLEQCLSEASQAGFIGIESGGKFPKNSEQLIPKLKGFNGELLVLNGDVPLLKKESLSSLLKFHKESNGNSY